MHCIVNDAVDIPDSKMPNMHSEYTIAIGRVYLPKTLQPPFIEYEDYFPSTPLDRETPAIRLHVAHSCYSKIDLTSDFIFFRAIHVVLICFKLQSLHVSPFQL